MKAWLKTHHAHGPSMDTLVFLPEDDEPEMHLTRWVRAPWLDDPGVIRDKPGAKMNKSFQDVIEHAVNYIYDEALDRDDARYYLSGYLEEKLREFAERGSRKFEHGFIEWLLGVD